MSDLRHPSKSAVVNAATMTLINPSGPNGTDPTAVGKLDRRFRIHKVAVIGGSGPLTITDVQTAAVIWKAPPATSAGDTFNEVPLRQMTAGQDCAIASTGATSIAVQYSIEGI